MSNEEKIVEMLVQIRDDISELKEGQARLEQEQADLKQGQANLEQGQANLKQGQANLEQGQANLEQGQANLEQGQADLKQGQVALVAEVTRIRQSVAVIEIEHGQYLRALGDGFALMLDKLEPLPDAVEALQEDVSVIKGVVTSHSRDINALKMAK